jgi:hypothetical protein
MSENDSIVGRLLNRIAPKASNKTPQTPTPQAPMAEKGKKDHGLAGAGLKALKVPGFKKGGKVKKTGIYKLHAGETVMTPEQFRKHKLGHKN